MGALQSRQSGTISQPSAVGTPLGPDDDPLKALPRAKSFDYVIVGGGTAGCVLASRLSEDPYVSVLLLEAGNKWGRLLTRMPMGFPKLFRSSVDWKYETTPQTALLDRPIYWPKGRILGGSSSINAMIYHRCAPEGRLPHVHLASYPCLTLGGRGWGYEGLKRYFERAERFAQHPTERIDASAHGSEGPWAVRPTSFASLAPISPTILQAAQNVGIPYTTDFNTSMGTLGVGLFQANIDPRHERSSTASAYLTDEVLKRPNLSVAVSMTGERILFAKELGPPFKALGVQFSTGKHARKFIVAAAREVIVCTGAIATPQLLMVSGLGPSEKLANLGIPMLHDLPAVGRNLRDHFSPGTIVFRAKPGYTWDTVFRSPLKSLAAFLQWITVGTGPLSSIGTQVALFVRSDDKRLPYGKPLPVHDNSSGPGAPDLELVFAPFAVEDSGQRDPPRGARGITTASVLLKPESSGTVELRSADIYEHPIINANYLSTESDMNLMIMSVRLLLRIANTPPLSDALDIRKTDIPREDLFWPGDADPEKITDEEIKSFIRTHGQSAWHPTSSARMGMDPLDSVVDPELRVHGIPNVRVVDSSVFPDQVSGHPCAIVVAIAERAADLISGRI
ncbi:GMC oxidoreductase [Pilatotrama ljubarskyi]|nr:GMC oxidoreductase [Pilatotrama ljubarskyi]